MLVPADHILWVFCLTGKKSKKDKINKMKKIFNQFFVYGLALMLLLPACRKADTILPPDRLVSFENETEGIAANEDSLLVKLVLTYATDRNTDVVVRFSEQGVVYGTDFTTVPEASGNAVTVTIPSGSREASFVIKKVSGRFYDGDEKLLFDIYSSASPVLIGVRKQNAISFSELLSASSNAIIDGGGSSFPNKVFIDLSANRHTAILRTNWDLGFYNDAADFRVILNSSSAMMAKQIDKNDLNNVSAADTAGISGDIAFSQFAPTTTSLPYIDYPNGDLTRTAIAQVSANAAENKVYIVNRGYAVGSPAPARGWKKIRIIQSATGGYTLQYADINAANFQEINISKDDTRFFKYVSFENGIVPIEPAKTKWDIAWTYFSNVTNFGSGEVPYLFQDMILLNRNVQSAQVMLATKAFADFSEADIATLAFNSSQTAIGASWRSGGGPGSAPAVRTDRYYIIKDPDNNIYKLRFTALTQNGQRGYPAYEAVLVKAG